MTKFPKGDRAREARNLASTGKVREKYLRDSPETVMEMDNSAELERLWDLYFPASQPRNVFEEAYLCLMREAIDDRLLQLRQ